MLARHPPNGGAFAGEREPRFAAGQVAPVVDALRIAGRDDDDGLLIALPPGWQQALGEAPITAVPVTTSSIGQVATGPDAVTAVGIVAVALVGALGLGALARRRRPA